MSNTFLDTSRLATLVRNKRGTKRLGQISKEIGNLSASTLSRIENGSIPDMQTFVVLCNWLKIPPGDLFETSQEEELDTEKKIILLILSDKRLDSSTAYALSQMIKATYRLIKTEE